MASYQNPYWNFWGNKLHICPKSWPENVEETGDRNSQDDPVFPSRRNLMSWFMRSHADISHSINLEDFCGSWEHHFYSVLQSNTTIKTWSDQCCISQGERTATIREMSKLVLQLWGHICILANRCVKHFGVSQPKLTTVIIGLGWDSPPTPSPLIGGEARGRNGGLCRRLKREQNLWGVQNKI